MFSVLLADDEQLDQEGLYRQIPWEELQVGEVRLARNGREVLEFLRQQAADILLSDISMPGMSGLELAAKAREVCPDIRVIFISGYDDFSYAQKAVELGVDGYILKPVETEEFCKVFRRSVQTILETKQQRDELHDMQDKATYGEFLKLSKSLADFLVLGRATPGVLEKIRTDIGNGPCGLALIEIEKYDEWINDIPAEEAENVLADFRRKFEVPEEGFPFLFAQTKPSRYALIYGAPDEMPFPVSKLQALIENVKKDCSLTVTISISDLVPEAGQLPAAYRECRSLLLQSVFSGPGTVVEQNVGALREGLSADYILSRMNGEILQSVRNMEAHHLLAFVEAVFGDMEARGIFPLTVVQNISIQIISRLQFALLEEKLGAAFLEDPLLWERVISASSFSALHEVVLDYFMQVA